VPLRGEMTPCGHQQRRCREREHTAYQHRAPRVGAMERRHALTRWWGFLRFAVEVPHGHGYVAARPARVGALVSRLEKLLFRLWIGARCTAGRRLDAAGGRAR
jgi:hypothetical protein